jgi:acyl-CoA thioester hydrolase
MEVMSVTSAPPFRLPIRIYYEDTDAGGVTYHANYLKFFERARTEYLRHIGIGLQEMADQHQAMFVMKSAQVEYHLPARLDEELIVITEVEKLGRASVIFAQKVWRGDECLVDGRFKLGCVDVNSVRPCVIPPVIHNAMQLKSIAPLSKINLVPSLI